MNTANNLATNAQFTPLRTPQVSPSHAVTELILTRHSPDLALIVLPMIAHLTKTSNRWVTWIVNQRVNKELLQSYGIDTGKLRIVHTSVGEDCRWMIWEALSTGTSECVIAAPGNLSEQEMSHFECAAQQGNSHGLMINYK